MTIFPASPVIGQMMTRPLLISALICHADRYFGSRDIVSVAENGHVHRYTYRDCHVRAKKMANVLITLGLKMGQRVATLAWNGYRHLELYYAIPGMGAVLHTLNSRLQAQQISSLINDAEDQYVFFERSMSPLIRTIAPSCKTVKAFIMMSVRSDLMEDPGIPGLLYYEDLLHSAEATFEWPLFDENSASSLCYGADAAGNPRGVLYSHRSTLLHAFASAMPDVLHLSSTDCVAPVAPMFHANGWGLPYCATLVGAKLVLTGPALDAESLYELFEREQVTFSAGAPSTWIGVLNHVTRQRLTFSSFRRIAIGGATCPSSIMRTLCKVHGIQAFHAFGITELPRIFSTSNLQSQYGLRPQEAQDVGQERQAQVLFGVDMRIVDDSSVELPWDSVAFGHLQVRGPWVVERYFRQTDDPILQDGWFHTGDLAAISADGNVRIVDRGKELSKSGAE